MQNIAALFIFAGVEGGTHVVQQLKEKMEEAIHGYYVVRQVGDSLIMETTGS